MAEKVLRALQQQGMDASWCERKADAMLGQSRLEVLEWIACSLDGGNKNVVADMLKIDVQDIQSLQRVLQKTRWV
ncbi:MAG: hypothetical protein COY49_06510 [Comamonadaceae bacterium CG_4_10_14_0_8_um_filter_57_29]|nr:MAG: hypothetical protein COY49_06510 [Comamonadaceae bacterium CG_4_10_14_0_8_um_filter_57_29]